MKRNQVADKYKWDLSGYCSDDEEFYERLSKLENKKNLFKKFEGKLDQDEILLDALDLESKISQELEILGCYAYSRHNENIADEKGQKMKDATIRVNTLFSVATAFITPEVSKFSDEKLQTLQKCPKFFHHKLYFHDIIKQKPHILEANEEVLISGMGEFLGGFSHSFDAFSDVDLKFDDVYDSKGKAHKLDQAKLSLYTNSKDQILRKNAMKNINRAFGNFSNFLAQNYLASVKADCYFSKVRKYSSSLASELYEEEISEEVYKNLIASVKSNIKFLYDFFEIKKNKLKLKKFSIFDQFAPIGRSLNKKYSYEEAFDLLKQSTKVLGEKYEQIVEKAFNQNWVDVFPNVGKASGAYSSGAYRKNPVILMNFVGDFRSVETLAHEMGHSVHSYLSEQSQIFEEADYSIFVAEVASTVNEMLLNFYMLNKLSSSAEKLALLDNMFQNVKSTIFRQTMFAEFEDWVHAQIQDGNSLSTKMLCDKYYSLNKFYFGNKVALIDEIRYEWARIPHFYSSYYVYKYATGLISALNIVSRILNGERDAVEKYIKFLSAGCSKPPIEILKDAGCDLENPATFDEVFKFLKSLLEEYKSL